MDGQKILSDEEVEALLTAFSGDNNSNYSHVCENHTGWTRKKLVKKFLENINTEFIRKCLDDEISLFDILYHFEYFYKDLMEYVEKSNYILDGMKDFMGRIKNYERVNISTNVDEFVPPKEYVWLDLDSNQIKSPIKKMNKRESDKQWKKNKKYFKKHEEEFKRKCKGLYVAVHNKNVIGTGKELGKLAGKIYSTFGNIPFYASKPGEQEVCYIG